MVFPVSVPLYHVLAVCKAGDVVINNRSIGIKEWIVFGVSPLFDELECYEATPEYRPVLKNNHIEWERTD